MDEKTMNLFSLFSPPWGAQWGAKPLYKLITRNNNAEFQSAIFGLYFKKLYNQNKKTKYINLRFDGGWNCDFWRVGGWFYPPFFSYETLDKVIFWFFLAWWNIAKLPNLQY